MFHWIDRKAHLPGGIAYEFRKAAGMEPLEVPDDVAGWSRSSIGRGVPPQLRAVTWRELLEKRREQQRERLERKRSCARGVRPAQLWVFYVDWVFFTGWYCYVREFWQGRKAEWAIKDKGYYREATDVQMHLMRTIPCGVLPAEDAFPQWMEAFAKQYPKRPTKCDPRKAGQVAGWTDGNGFWLTKREALEGRLS